MLELWGSMGWAGPFNLGWLALALLRGSGMSKELMEVMGSAKQLT